MSDVKLILSKRKNTHGSFIFGANIEQNIKNILRFGTNWHTLEPFKKITLDIIALKISRILEGDSNFLDHWDDIIGYVERTKECIGGLDVEDK